VTAGQRADRGRGTPGAAAGWIRGLGGSRCGPARRPPARSYCSPEHPGQL